MRKKFRKELKKFVCLGLCAVIGATSSPFSYNSGIDKVEAAENYNIDVLALGVGASSMELRISDGSTGYISGLQSSWTGTTIEGSMVTVRATSTSSTKVFNGVYAYYNVKDYEQLQMMTKDYKFSDYNNSEINRYLNDYEYKESVTIDKYGNACFYPGSDSDIDYDNVVFVPSWIDGKGVQPEGTSVSLVLNADGGQFGSYDEEEIKLEGNESGSPCSLGRYNEPKKLGYKFAGWRANNASSKIVQGSEYEELPGHYTYRYTIYQDTVFYAIWEEDRKSAGYTLSLDGNGGEVRVEDKYTTTAVVNKLWGIHTLSGLLPKREGYEFMYWTTEKDGSGTKYYNAGEIDMKSNITLHAQWKSTSTPTPVVQTPTPVVQTVTPVVQTATPVVAPTKTPVVQTATPVVQTSTPVVQTVAPTSTTVVQTATPVVQTSTPAVPKQHTVTLQCMSGGEFANGLSMMSYTTDSNLFVITKDMFPVREGYTLDCWISTVPVVESSDGSYILSSVDDCIVIAIWKKAEETPTVTTIPTPVVSIVTEKPSTTPYVPGYPELPSEPNVTFTVATTSPVPSSSTDTPSVSTTVTPTPTNPVNMETGKPEETVVPTDLPTPEVSNGPINSNLPSGTEKPGTPSATEKPATDKPAGNIKCSVKKVSLGKGEKWKIPVTNVKGRKVVYVSSNSCVKVSSTGVVKGSKTGSSKVYVVCDGKKLSVNITVRKAPKSVKLSAKKIVLKKGQSKKLKVYLTKGSASKKLKWKTKNKKVATVANGKITAKKKGKTYVAVTTYNGKKTWVEVVVK